MLRSEAFTLISRAIDSGNAANAYLVVGDIKNEGEELVKAISHKLYPREIEQVKALTHPDIHRLEPEGAKRIIKVEAMRNVLVEPMLTTAFSGGWKLGIIIGADRMEAPSANAFLKTLEEPPEKTLFLLLTDMPDALLPTIVSRCQRVDLPLGEGILKADAYEKARSAFFEKNSSALVELLGELKEEADDSEAIVVKRKFFKTLLGFAREIMLSRKVEAYSAYRNVEAIEEAFRQSEKSMGDEMILSFMLDRIKLP